MQLERNFDGVQFEKYRKVVDAKFNALHDELSDCYYQFWKKGLSNPFQGYDVQATPEESKTLFDKLHGLLWVEYELAMKAHHDTAIEKEAKFDQEYTEIPTDKEGKPLGESKIERAQAQKTILNLEGYAIQFLK